jgi:hypothetical protein
MIYEAIWSAYAFIGVLFLVHCIVSTRHVGRRVDGPLFWRFVCGSMVWPATLAISIVIVIYDHYQKPASPERRFP